jgi:hypothetical protein
VTVDKSVVDFPIDGAPFKRLLSRQPIWCPLFIEPDAVRAPSIPSLQNSDGGCRNLADFSRSTVGHGSPPCVRSGGQAHPGSFPQRLSIIQYDPDGERQSRNLLNPSPWAQLVAIRNCLCCNLTTGMRRRRAGDHQNGTCPTSIRLRRKETIAVVRLTRLLD